MKEKMLKVISYLENEYTALLDCCGKDDEINVIPCKEALESAKEIAKAMAMIEG